MIRTTNQIGPILQVRFVFVTGPCRAFPLWLVTSPSSKTAEGGGGNWRSKPRLFTYLFQGRRGRKKGNRKETILYCKDRTNHPFSPMSFTGIRFCAFCASCASSGGICRFCKRKNVYTFFPQNAPSGGTTAHLGSSYGWKGVWIAHLVNSLGVPIEALKYNQCLLY